MCLAKFQGPQFGLSLTAITWEGDSYFSKQDDVGIKSLLDIIQDTELKKNNGGFSSFLYCNYIDLES